MSRIRNAVTLCSVRVLDAAAAALAAVWPRSAAVREAERLVDEGYEPGEACDVAFSLSFSGALDTRAALAVARASGVTVADLSEVTRGFVTVQVPSRVRAYDLSLAARRMNRLADACGGFAAEIGPVASSRRQPALLLHAPGDAVA
jgi:hypothetical protein